MFAYVFIFSNYILRTYIFTNTCIYSIYVIFRNTHTYIKCYNLVSVYNITVVCTLSGLTMCYWITNPCVLFPGEILSPTLSILSLHVGPFVEVKPHALSSIHFSMSVGVFVQLMHRPSCW